MKSLVLSIIILFLSCSTLLAESRITEENLLSAYEIPQSQSPNGKYALFLINKGLTTATVVGFMPVTKNRFLGESTVWGQGLNPGLYKKYATILWSNDSKYVALHDSHSLHSKLHVFSINDSSAKEVPLPDLIDHISKEKPEILQAKASGQLPIKWKENEVLEVKVRYKTSNGTIVNVPIELEINFEEN